MPAEAGIQDANKLNEIGHWIPACAGMTPFPLIATQPPRGEGREGVFSLCCGSAGLCLSGFICVQRKNFEELSRDHPKKVLERVGDVLPATGLRFLSVTLFQRLDNGQMFPSPFFHGPGLGGLFPQVPERIPADFVLELQVLENGQ